MIRIGIDCGGTFTDIVVIEDQKTTVHKIPSSPSNPIQSVLKGLQKFVDQGKECELRNGISPPVTLQDKSKSKCVLITTEGFEDLIELGREERQNPYSLDPGSLPSLISESGRIGIKERCLADGTHLLPLDNKELERVKALVKKAGPDTIAICLLHSYANPENEIKIKEGLEGLGVPIFLSHQVLPEMREYERSSATLLNALIQPEIEKYISSLEELESLSIKGLEFMQANGGVTTTTIAKQEPARLLDSGPAGGVVAAFKIAKQAGQNKVLALEIGGTSARIAFCDGSIPLTRERRHQGYPLPLPSVDIVDIGPGGGAIAWVDGNGLLRVGPESAGIDPGPICYGKGDQITLCDAYVFLNRIDPDNFLGGEMILKTEKISPALDKIGEEMKKKGGTRPSNEEIAEGIIRIANASLAGGIRTASQERGCNPADLTMVAYGGAGPLHACDLAKSLRISRVIVPPHPGVLASFGILGADLIEDSSRTVLLNSSQSRISGLIVKNFKEMKSQVREKLMGQSEGKAKIEFQEFVDLRYPGQSREIRIPYSRNFIKAFHKEHHAVYGHSDPTLPVEIVAVRIRGRIRNPVTEQPSQKSKSKNPPGKALIQERSIYLGGDPTPTPYYLRSLLGAGNQLPGPSIVMEYSSTTLISAEFEAEIDQWDNLVIENKGK